MPRILLKGGRLIDPASKRDELLDVLIDNGRIAAIGRDLDAEGAEMISVEDRWICPGLIDLHVHLREPGQEDKETIATGASAAVNGGFTAVCCMPNTDPPLDDAGSIRYVLDRARSAGQARVHPVGAITRGLEGKSLTNMVSLAEEGAVALSDDGRTIMDALIMRRAMEYARGIPLPLTLHSIDENLARGGQMNEGRVAAFLGLAGIPSHAESIAVARDIALAELTGARVHIAHVSTAGAVDLIRAARARGIAVSGEVTPHHLALTDDKVIGYDTRFKMNPPLRTPEDREALRAALADGTIDCIATDHAPHTEIEKDYPFDDAPFGVTGLETAVPVTFSVLVETGILSPMRWIETLSLGPARAFNLPGGKLEIGGPADITVLDPKAERVVRPEAMKSRARNSCFLGEKYRCWPIMTFVGGKRLL